MLGESKAGTHNQSTAPSGATSAPVWQLERNAYSAMGGNGDGAAALCGMRSLFVAALTASAMARATFRSLRRDRQPLWPPTYRAGKGAPAVGCRGAAA